ATAAVLWAPTIRGQPSPSSALIAPLPVEGGSAGATLAPWRVTVLRPALFDLLAALSTSTDRQALAQGVIAGPDFVFWGWATRQAASLVARGRLLPGITRIPEAGSYVATWVPLLAVSDAEHLQDLAAHMPGACLALHADAAPPSARSPHQALLEFVSA